MQEAKHTMNAARIAQERTRGLSRSAVEDGLEVPDISKCYQGGRQRLFLFRADTDAPLEQLRADLCRLAACFMNGEECFEQRFQVLQIKGVCAVGFGVGGVVVDLEEESIDTRGDGCAGKDRDELRLAAADPCGG